MTIIKQRLGARVHELRKKHHFTQEVLGEMLGISPSYLSGIERGRQNPSLDLLIKLANFLEVEIWELFDLEHEQNMKEVQTLLNKTITSMDEKTFRQMVKVVRAMVR